MSIDDIAKRLSLCLAPPYYTCVFSEDLISLEEISKVIIRKGLQAFLGARKTLSFDDKISYGIIYIREDNCWRDCMNRCGSEETGCFPRCFYDCLNEIYVHVKDVLEGGEA